MVVNNVNMYHVKHISKTELQINSIYPHEKPHENNKVEHAESSRQRDREGMQRQTDGVASVEYFTRVPCSLGVFCWSR